MKIKLKDLKCSMCRFNNEKGSYEERINLNKSPWYIYLLTQNTDELLKNFEEIRKHPSHPKDYYYPITDFDRLYTNIKEKGYLTSFTNSKEQRKFNNENWKGGKGPVKIGNDGFIWDGHHRCAILLYIYGPEYEVNIVDNILEDIPINQTCNP